MYVALEVLLPVMLFVVPPKRHMRHQRNRRSELPSAVLPVYDEEGRQNEVDEGFRGAPPTTAVADRSRPSVV